MNSLSHMQSKWTLKNLFLIFTFYYKIKNPHKGTEYEETTHLTFFSGKYAISC